MAVSTRRLRLAVPFAVLAFLVLLVVAAPSASALPFYGFNSIAPPCPVGQETTTRCTDNTEFSWHGGKPFIYRFAVSKRCVDRYDGGYSDGGDWRRYDNAVDRLRNNNGEPFMVIQWAPYTGSTNCEGWKLPSTDYEYNQFYWWVRNLVRHYRSRGIQDYEVWNEANLKGAATGDANVNPSQYAYTYCNAWWALRDEGIGARLHLGGIADNGATGNTNPSDRYSLDTWLRDVRGGINASCNDARVSGVSTHKYWEGNCYNPMTRSYSTDYYTCLSVERYWVNTHWGPDKLLMLTEAGAGDDARSFYPSTINRDQQRRNVASMLNACAKAWEYQYMRACYYYPIKEERNWPYCSFGSTVNAGLDGARSVYGLVKATCNINTGEPYPAWWEYYNKLGTLG
jgi:hypothetical protein